MPDSRRWRPSREGLGIVDDGLVACRDGLICYAGPAARRARRPRRAAKSSTASGRWITPGLIDCHTHLVYAGDRAAEFEQRLNGVSYEAIARARRRHPLDGERHARRERSAAGRRHPCRASTRCWPKA